LKTVVTAVALWLTTLLISGVSVETAGDSTGETILTFLIIGLIFGLVNAIIKPIVKFFTFPLVVLTLGLFMVVITARMMMPAFWIPPHAELLLHVDHVLWAVGGSLILSLLNLVISSVVD